MKNVGAEDRMTTFKSMCCLLAPFFMIGAVASTFWFFVANPMGTDIQLVATFLSGGIGGCLFGMVVLLSR
jgi:hypothetical protein